MSRKLAVMVSLLASCMVNGVVRAQPAGAESCVGEPFMAQTASALPALGWMQWSLMALCLVLFVVAYLLIFFVTLRHRRSAPQGKWWRDSLLADLLWTLVPLLLVVAMLWPIFKPMLLAQHLPWQEGQALGMPKLDAQTPGTATPTSDNCLPPTAQS